MTHRIRAGSLAVSLLVLAQSALALPEPTRNEPRSFLRAPLQAIRSAPLVAVVECVIAGSGVATYRIIEAVRGPPAGTVLTMRRLNIGGLLPGPLSFVGHRFFVVAEPWTEGIVGVTGQYFSPRPFDYLVTWEAPETSDAFLTLGDVVSLRGPGAFASATKTIAALTDLPPAALEFLDAKDAAMFALLCGTKDAPTTAAACLSLKQATNDAQLVERVRHLAADARGDAASRLASTVACTWPRRMADMLENGSGSFGTTEVASRMASARCAEPVRVIRGPDEGPRLGDGDALAAARALRRLSDDMTAGGSITFQTLTEFAHECRGDCVTTLRHLDAARNAWVRVGAAVYRTVLGDSTADGALRALAASDTLPGAWAAVALARRGERAAATHAFRVLHDAQSADPFAFVLENTLMILVDNSAWRSGIPVGARVQPGMSNIDAFRSVSDFWSETKDRIMLADPWLPLFDALRADE